MTPLIGITTYLETARWGPWDGRAALIPESYVAAAERAGGRPVLLPPSDRGADESLGAIDALVLAGGADVDPSLYGAEPDPETAGTRPHQDRSELSLLALALERELPVLAICRGMQLLNVARGGDLIQHLPDTVGHDAHRRAPGRFEAHAVELAPESRLGGILGAQVSVPSHHHQGVGRLGDGVVAVGWAPDGVVEAVELTGAPFVVGVQWHPEEDSGDLRLFESLVEEADAYRRRG